MDASTGPPPALEAALWWAPALVALWCAARAAPEQRRTWATVALACAVIGLDKLVDLLIRAHSIGQKVVRWFDPGGLRGSTAGFRYLLLGGLFLGGVGALYLVARTERRRSRPERMALLGLVGVLGYLALRLVPSVGDALTPLLRWGIEYTCWAFVLAGAALGARVRAAA